MTAVDDLMKQTAAAMAEQFPEELLTRLMEAKLKEVFESLLRSYGSGDQLRRVVEQAVEQKLNELLRTTYAPQVAEVANTLAIEAIGLARREMKVVTRRG